MKPLMKVLQGMIPIFILLILAAPLSFLKGCGTIDQEEGCPAVNTMYSSCLNWANDTDILEGPSDGTIEFSGYLVPVGSVHYVPLLYVVTDSKGVPRSNICVEFYTDGYFYSDRLHTTVAPGYTDRIILRTNDRGAICLYWSTEDLPASNPSGGEDIPGDSFVSSISGVVQHRFQIDWNVAAFP